MIKKRLFGLMADSKKQIIQNVLWQWFGLLASIVAMFTAGRLLETGYSRSLERRQLLLWGAVIFFSILCRAVCSREGAKASCMAGNDVKKELRRRLYEKLMSLGSSYHEKVPTASAVQVAVEGVEQLEIYFGKYLPQLFYSLLAPVTLFLVLSRISVKASLVLLVCVPLIPMTIMAVQKLAKRLLKKYWGIYTELGDSFLENLQGLTTLKIYQADEGKAREMDREAEHFRKITMKVLMMQLNSIIVMDVVAYGGAAVGMIVTLREFLSGNIGLGGACTIILLSSEFFIPMRLLGSFFHIAMNGMAAADRLFAILDLEEEEAGQGMLPEGPLEIVLEDVKFSYEPERPVLENISMNLPGIGMVSLAGLSGCGKSTIAAILTGKNRGYQGGIRINGMELSSIAEGSLMSRITLVSHNSYLFKGTVEENLKMAAPKATRNQMEEALREVNLYDFLMEQSGLETEIAERGSNFSGGQCQRLALARALLHDTAVYIFDEATSNIDAESEGQIMKVIRKLALSHSVLLISHRLANVVDSNRIYVLKDGRISEEGRHEELLERDGIYSEMYLGQKALEDYALSNRKGGERYA
ncbi:MAG: ABC transporter ATP-binding protein/permease [Clostridiales bacterium]|nr:ABC transporter ATP-binding protein/permease [Clostridiales bacterium]